MKHKALQPLSLVVAALSLLALQACGDVAHTEEASAQPQGNSVPASALASSRAFSLYVGALSASTPVDASETLSLDGMTAPSSETEEPVGAV